jgi:hypothetical protein
VKNKSLKKIIENILCLLVSGVLFSFPVFAEESSNWTDKVTLNGVIEVEANYEETSAADVSDIALATVELGIDADIAEHIGGHLLLLWEDGDNGINVDEGFITLDRKDVMPLYLDAGKMYIPFGNFESHFISDPLTLEIGETNEVAVKLGYAGKLAEASVAIYNGDVNQTGDDNHIDDFAAGITITPVASENFSVAFGASYISNLGDSDGLEGEITSPPGTIQDDAPGMGAFASLSIQEKFFVEIEYISAMDDFQAGELNFDNGETFKPEAWSFEVAFAASEKLELALRWETGTDLGDDFLPKERYGVAASYALYDATTIAVEYLHSSFENNDESDGVTVQLGIEF